MIISRKRFEEKMRQAIENAEKERCIFERIDRVNRELAERINELHRHICALEEQIVRMREGKNDGT